MAGKDRKKLAAYGAMLAILAVIAGILWGNWDGKPPSLQGPEKPGLVRQPGSISVGSTTGTPVQPISAVGPLGPGGALGPGGPLGPGGELGPGNPVGSTSTATSATAVDSE